MDRVPSLLFSWDATLPANKTDTINIVAVVTSTSTDSARRSDLARRKKKQHKVLAAVACASLSFAAPAPAPQSTPVSAPCISPPIQKQGLGVKVERAGTCQRRLNTAGTPK